LKLTFVVPRYGPAVAGGAETAARNLAERLVSRGWEVSVLTTVARDHTTWLPAEAPGQSWVSGVSVRRFPVLGPRHPGFEQVSGPLLAAPEQATLADAHAWVEKQGPVSPDLLDALSQDESDLVAFYPYLYHPTVKGLPAVAARSVLHPAAHDEPALRLPVFRDVFAQAAGLVFHTYAERRLVERLFPVSGHHEIVLGVGVDPGLGDGPTARSELGLGTRPFLLSLGRVDEQKGTTALVRAFLAYKESRPGPLVLVLAGPVVDAPPAHPDILAPGAVPEEVKWGLLRETKALISASALESFSLVLVEAWSVGTPALVNARCQPTVELSQRAGGGLAFRGYAELASALDRLLTDDSLRRHLGRRGQGFVEANLRWSVVLDRYESFLRNLRV
jgi:glycosyltransferase involved in cell wall biosynthesis